MDWVKMRPGHWLGLVLYVSFSALTLTVGKHKGHLAHRKSHSTNLQMYFSEKVEDLRGGGNQLTKVHLKKRLLNVSTCMIYLRILGYSTASTGHK